MKTKLLIKSFLVAVGLCAGVNASWATPTIIKTYDFDAATAAASSQTVLAYSGTTTINKTSCDNLTGDWAGIAVQGAGSWHIYHTNSKGVLQGNGYYNNNGGGRLFGILSLKAGDIVHITASGGLANSATNATYDAVNSTEGTDCYYTVTSDGNFGVSLTRYYYIHVVTIIRDLADLELPTYDITGVNGTERQVTLSCLTDGADIKYNTVNDKSAPGWTTYTAPFYTSEGTLYAYSEKSSNTSDVITISTGAGAAITLNAPTIAGTFVSNGLMYNPNYTFSSDQAGKVIGDPTITYTYSFNSGASTGGTSFSPSSNGSLTVTVSAEGYTSNSTTQDVFGGDFIRTYFFDAINDVTVDTESGTWEYASNVNGAQWTFTSIENCTYTLRSDISFTNFMYARATTAQTKQGFYTRLNAGSINFSLADGEAIVFSTLGNSIITGSSATSQAIARYTNVRSISIYTPATEVDYAIIDCKHYESSDAFATAVAAESFSTAAEVYAFHTAWQIAQAKASGSKDLTKLIRNAAIADATDWGGANLNYNQQYTGAPDNTYIDIYNNTINTNQTIYGVPAGTYKIKAATRAAVGTSGTLYVNDGTSDIAKVSQITNVGNTGGDLGNGWSWSEMIFTLTETKNLLIGFWANATSEKWAGCDDWHMELLGVSATIGSTGWTTFASPYALDLSSITATEGEVKAYYASSVNTDKVRMISTDKNDVIAGEGLMFKGTVGAVVTIPVVASGTAVDGNLLVGCTTETNLTNNANYYVLVNNGGTPEFQCLADNGATIPAGKAYLNAPTAGARLSIVFDDETTGIVNLPTANSKGEGAVYNLNGQRVQKAQKSLYIIDGKKVMVK